MTDIIHTNDASYYTKFKVQLRIGPELYKDFFITKIMRKGQKLNEEERAFEELVDGAEIPKSMLNQICSLSDDEHYYDMIEKLEPELAREVLTTLRDALFSTEIREAFQSELCFKTALLCETSARQLLATVGSRFGALRHLVSRFKAVIHLPGASAPHEFTFDFEPRANAPYRINSIIGLNGVGKTQVMARLAMLLSGFSKAAKEEDRATMMIEGMLIPFPAIDTVVAVSFSAFDEFDRPTKNQGEKFKYSYCGLQNDDGQLKNKESLLADIREMFSEDIGDEKRALVKSALKHIVPVANIDTFLDYPDQYEKLYEMLSAGQRLVLNCMLHIISKISPRTLILFDQPELHLHPQLLMSLLSALMEILEKQDSFAIIATHSPLVIQQMPKECVHVVIRDGSTPIIMKPTFQTFGESLDNIMSFVFSAT